MIPTSSTSSSQVNQGGTSKQPNQFSSMTGRVPILPGHSQGANTGIKSHKEPRSRGAAGARATSGSQAGSKGPERSGSMKDKRKLSENGQRLLRGFNNNLANGSGIAQSDMSRSQNSRGQSRGKNQRVGGMPILHNRLSQSGFSSGAGGLSSACGLHSFQKNNNKHGSSGNERKQTSKLGSRHNELETSSNFAAGLRDQNNDSQANGDSEGEVGDHCRFAERANGFKVQINDQNKPLPHFERSIFDKYMEFQQQKNTSHWNQTCIEPVNENKAAPHGQFDRKTKANASEVTKNGKHKKGEKSISQQTEEPYGCVVKGNNQSQVTEMPEGFPLAHPQDLNLRDVHPQRITQKFQESRDVCITFDSDFCSGNLSKVCKGNNKNEYLLWISNDSAPYLEDGYRTWFYFSVHGVPQGEQLTFTFKNLNVQSKLYGQGLKPVFRVLPNTQKKWRRIFTKVNYFFNSDDQFILKFQHMFSNQPNETTFFAFSYPFSYEESQAKIDSIQKQFEAAGPDKNLYFHRETVYYSIEGRKMEMMTISSKDGITEERETIPTEGASYQCTLYPEAKDDPTKRPLRFEQNKKVVVFTSRVHPGETPGSHVLNGLIDVITDLKSEQGRLLRKNFVFKIIPTLNPDGVARGYYRLDSLGQNLNRFYNDPERRDQPTIWAAKKAICQYANEYKNLEVYIDFHAHASKKGVFMFGNALPDNDRQADNITFAKLIAMNCLNFDMNECNFSEKIMSIKDKNGMSRDGSSRVALQKATGLTYCYTLECNYHNGKRINILAPKFIKGLGYIEEETPVTDANSKIYANTNSPPFTQEIFEDVGNAVAVALLDHIGTNPISRLPLSCYKTVENVRDDIMNNLAKYSAGQVNVCGVNHFSQTNTKVSKQYQKTEVSCLKGDKRTKQSNSANKDTCILGKQQTIGSKAGTFGVAKRIIPDKLKKVAKGSVHTTSNSAHGGTGPSKQKTYSIGETSDNLLKSPANGSNFRLNQQFGGNQGKNAAGFYDSNSVLVHNGVNSHQAEMIDNLSPKYQQILQRNALQLRYEQYMLNSKITASQLEGMSQHEQLVLLKQQQEFLLMKQQIQQMAMQSKQEQKAMSQIYGGAQQQATQIQMSQSQLTQSNQQNQQHQSFHRSQKNGQQPQRLWSDLTEQEQLLHLQMLKQQQMQQKEMRKVMMLQQQQQAQQLQKEDAQFSKRHIEQNVQANNRQSFRIKNQNVGASILQDCNTNMASNYSTIVANEQNQIAGAVQPNMAISGHHQSLKLGLQHIPLALDRERMGLGCRNNDKEVTDKVDQNKSFQQKSDQQNASFNNNDLQQLQQMTPGSSYSKSRKRKNPIKEKGQVLVAGEPVTTSNAAPSSQSKEVYEGGSNDKNLKNGLLLGTGSSQKTPKHHNSSGLVIAHDSALTNFPQFIQQHAVGDFNANGGASSSQQVHLPDIELKSQYYQSSSRQNRNDSEQKQKQNQKKQQLHPQHCQKQAKLNEGSLAQQLIQSPRSKQALLLQQQQPQNMMHMPLHQLQSFSNRGTVQLKSLNQKYKLQSGNSLPQSQYQLQVLSHSEGHRHEPGQPQAAAQAEERSLQGLGVPRELPVGQLSSQRNKNE